MNSKNISLDTKLYLQHSLEIHSIKNEIYHDEDVATLSCSFADHVFTAYWSYSNGFVINADIFTTGALANSLIVDHVRKQMNEMTIFHGYDAEKGWAGLVVKNKN